MTWGGESWHRVFRDWGRSLLNTLPGGQALPKAVPTCQQNRAGEALGVPAAWPVGRLMWARNGTFLGIRFPALISTRFLPGAAGMVRGRWSHPSPGLPSKQPDVLLYLTI